MHLSTSSSERPVPKHSWPQLGLIAAIVTIAFFIPWELFVRSMGYAPTLNDSNDLWAENREILEREPDRVSILGASRARFDLDLDVMEEHLGERPVMLAINGSCGRPQLSHLANDPEYRGLVIINITEGLWYNQTINFGMAMKVLNYYPTWSPSQRVGHEIAKFLEMRLAFLRKEDLSLKALIDEIELPNRPSMIVRPKLPPYFCEVHEDRREVMWKKVEEDPEFADLIKERWKGLLGNPDAPPIGPVVRGPELDLMLADIRRDVETIRARGGDVIFLRLPSTGFVRDVENEFFPRAEYWDKLLHATRTQGVHYEDYPELTGFDCPEWSHLTGEDATRFTNALMPILMRKIKESRPE